MLIRVRTAAVGVISLFSESALIKEGKKSSGEASENQNCKLDVNSLLRVMLHSSVKTGFWAFVDNILLVIKNMGKRIFIGNPPNNLLVLLGFTIIVLWSRLQQMKERQNLGKFILTLDL